MYNGRGTVTQKCLLVAIKKKKFYSIGASYQQLPGYLLWVSGKSFLAFCLQVTS